MMSTLVLILIFVSSTTKEGRGGVSINVVAYHACDGSIHVSIQYTTTTIYSWAELVPIILVKGNV